MDIVVPQFDTLIPEDTNVTVDADLLRVGLCLVMKLDMLKI